jgi:hypothetical protein
MKPSPRKVAVRSVVKGGVLQRHAVAGLFRLWLRGRKPSVLLAWFWLFHDEGALLALQYELNPTKPRKPRIYTNYRAMERREPIPPASVIKGIA